MGRGYILLYKFPAGFVGEMGCIPGFLRGSFAGGLGAVMIVDYAASNVAARQATVGIEIDHELQLV